jgi:DNA-binding LacI/PurR family transcriptional regulator
MRGLRESKQSPVRPVTQEDVARALGVSRTLVSFAFRGAPGVGKQTRLSILETAERMGYEPNAAAAELASRRSSAVGLYFLDIQNDVYIDIFNGVREVMDARQHRLVLSVAPEGRSAGPLVPLIQARTGIVIAATLLESDEEIQELSRRVPIINVARRVEGTDSVFSDDLAGARLATEHLIGLGHTRITHLACPARQGQTERRTAYEETMRLGGLTPHVLETADNSREAAEHTAFELLRRPDRPTAVFAHNDELALGVREAALRLGLGVPWDLSLVGYDNSRTARLRGIELTSVDLQAAELGRTAARAAIARLSDPLMPPIHTGTKPTLISRASVAPR